MKKQLLSIALLALFSQTASANLLVNGSFEDVTGGNETLFSDIWYFESSSQLVGWAPYSGVTAQYYAEVRDEAHLNGGNTIGDAQEGTKYLELDTHHYTSPPDGLTNGGVTQSLNGLTSGGTFDLSFWYSPRVNTSGNTNDFDVYWNGALVQSFTNLTNNTNNHIWTEFTASLIGDLSGTNTLSFIAQGQADVLGASIDNVVLTASVAAVPEPEAYAMFLAGLGLLGFTARKRKA